VLAFIDDTPAKQGHLVDGLEVIALTDAVARHPGAAVVVTMLNQHTNFRAARRVVERHGREALSFAALAWSYPETFLPWLALDLPQRILAAAAEIRAAFDLLADEESRRQLVQHLAFRLRCDYAALPEALPRQYFPIDILPRLPDDTTFVDCGAFDGDTVRAFLAHQGGRFERVHALEPDPASCRRLRSFVDGLDAAVGSKIEVVNAAVGAHRERRRFSATGDEAAAFSSDGSVDVEVLPLLELVDPSARLYIKMDIEGAEAEALAGAAPLIRRSRPTLAISVYHRPGDLWQLPLYLNSLSSDYRLFLRTHGEDGTDIVCYALAAAGQ